MSDVIASCLQLNVAIADLPAEGACSRANLPSKLDGVGQEECLPRISLGNQGWATANLSKFVVLSFDSDVQDLFVIPSLLLCSFQPSNLILF
jgi:hypothetical protein